MSTHGHEEHRSMDHEAERESRKSEEEINLENEDHHERVREIVNGGDEGITQNYVRYFDVIQRDGDEADQLAISEHVQWEAETESLPEFGSFVDRSDKNNLDESSVSIEAPGSEVADGTDNSNLRESRKTIETRRSELIDRTHTKCWYARWKFWAFIGGTASTDSSTGSALFAGLVLRSPPKPDDPNYDAIKSAREQWKRWRNLPDSAFWPTFKSHVQTKQLSLETQQALMQYVQMYFPSPWVPFAGGEATRIRDEMVLLYYANVAKGPDLPSCAIYEQFSQGLRATDVQTHQAVTLPRSQVAAIAEMALFELIQQRNSE